MLNDLLINKSSGSQRRIKVIVKKIKSAKLPHLGRGAWEKKLNYESFNWEESVGEINKLRRWFSRKDGCWKEVQMNETINPHEGFSLSAENVLIDSQIQL